MAVSTTPPPPPPPPPPPDPTPTVAGPTTTTSSNFRPSHRLPPNRLSQTSPFFSTTPTTEYPHPIPLLPSNPNPNYPPLVPSHDSTAPTTSAPAAAILYPVASSGRGFIARQMPPTNPNTNSNNFLTARPAVLSSSYHRPPFAHSHRDPALGQAANYASNGVGNPTHLQQATVVGNSAVKGAAVSAAFSQSQHKVALSSTPVSSFNGHKDLRERSKDDVFVTVHDRKVRASDNASLYALCRSWLKNGSPEESQLQNLDAVRSLPRPLPLSSQDSTSPTIVEESKEVEEDEGSVDNLSQKELLQRHVQHAKRVRSRLRGQRLRRIAPYKNRLSLLLHPVVDSNFRNDSVTGEMK